MAAFGWGIGDIWLLSQLAVTAYNAWKDAPEEYQGLVREVLGLNATINALKEERDSPTSLIYTASHERKKDMKMLVENCIKGMRKLGELAKTYSKWDLTKKRKVWRRVKFGLEHIQAARDMLAMHTSSMNLFLTTLANGSMGRMEFLIRYGKKEGERANSNSAQQVSGSRDIATVPAAVTTEGQPWQTMWAELVGEGFNDSDVEKYQQDIKAYMRYLVSGHSPFWKAEKQAGEGMFNVLKEMKQLKRERQIEPLRHRLVKSGYHDVDLERVGRASERCYERHTSLCPEPGSAPPVVRDRSTEGDHRRFDEQLAEINSMREKWRSFGERLADEFDDDLTSAERLQVEAELKRVMRTLGELKDEAIRVRYERSLMDTDEMLNAKLFLKEQREEERPKYHRKVEREKSAERARRPVRVGHVQRERSPDLASVRYREVESTEEKEESEKLRKDFGTLFDMKDIPLQHVLDPVSHEARKT